MILSVWSRVWGILRPLQSVLEVRAPFVIPRLYLPSFLSFFQNIVMFSRGHMKHIITTTEGKSKHENPANFC